MNIPERRKYLVKMRPLYRQAQKKSERGRLPDEMEAVTGLHRKSLLRLLHGNLARKPRRKQRGKVYGAKVQAVIEKVARSLDYPCAERLKPNLVWMTKQLAAHGELEVDEKTLQLPERIGVSTLRRRLPSVQRAAQRMAHRQRRPTSSSALKATIPMRKPDWAERRPGHFEVDLVHHCGRSTEGQYVHTLQMVDVAGGWSECVAVLGRSYLTMQDGFERIRRRLPFAIREIHPDNGAEFLNAHLLRYWQDKVKAELSRSRPYRKNDNRFVEENNFSLVRAYVGYGRLDTVEQTHLLNLLYEKLGLYHNLFRPVMRLREKRAKEGSARMQRIYDRAQPPLDRLIAAGVLAPHQQAYLLALRRSINPLVLRQEIESLLDRLFRLPGASAGQVEDAHLILLEAPKLAAA